MEKYVVFDNNEVFQVGEEIECKYKKKWYRGKITKLRPLKVKRPKDWRSWKCTDVRKLRVTD